MEVHIEYSDTGEEPTLRIDTDSSGAINILRNVFQQLASGERSELEFRAIDGLQIIGDVSLWLKRTEEKNERPLTVKQADSTTFIWTLTPAGWEDCVFWLNGLTHSGHQYLTNGRNDDAVIVIGFQERPLD